MLVKQLDMKTGGSLTLARYFSCCGLFIKSSWLYILQKLFSTGSSSIGLLLVVFVPVRIVRYPTNNITWKVVHHIHLQTDCSMLLSNLFSCWSVLDDRIAYRNDLIVIIGSVSD